MREIKKEIEQEEKLTFEEALENLTVISEMPIDEKTPIGILKNKRITTTEEDFLYKEIEWLYPEDPIDFLDHIKPSYQVILKYLKELYEDREIDFKDSKIKESIKSILTLVSDATFKLNEYFLLFGKKIEFEKTKEFKDIQEFYLKNLFSKIPGKLEGKKAWHEKWEEEESTRTFNLDESSLKNFEAILEDREYELFQLKDSFNNPAITKDLIKNIKIYTDFDDIFSKEDVIFKELKKFKDKNMQGASLQILKMVKKEVFQFYKMGFNFKKSNLAKEINKALMALMLSSNYKNIEKRKNCLKYFQDFELFLRKSFLTDEYFQVDSSEKTNFLIDFLHKLSFVFFLRKGSVKEEIIGFIHLILNTKIPSFEENISFWNEILEEDDFIYKFLKKYRSGPLVKILDVLRLEESNIFGFDPIFQENIPESLYEVFLKENKVEVLHLPSPTSQESISKAKITEEFLGFLRYDKSKHLLFNFQNRNSLREKARAETLEKLSQRVEFLDKLFVITLDKDSNFYHQQKDFYDQTSFEVFEKEMKNEIFKEKYFFFSKNLKSSKLSFEKFIDQSFKLIHKHIFLEKKDLAREERLVFIEIFYHFLILKSIELISPKTISFTCKDGLDIGASLNFSFFCFLKLLKNFSFTKEEKEFLRYLLYAPSLLVRERKINTECLIRQVSFIAFLDSKKDNLKALFQELKKLKFFSEEA